MASDTQWFENRKNLRVNPNSRHVLVIFNHCANQAKFSEFSEFSVHNTIKMSRHSIQTLFILMVVVVCHNHALQTQMFRQIEVINFDLLSEATLTKLQCFHHCLTIQDCQGVQYNFGKCWLYTNLMFIYGPLSGLEKMWINEKADEMYHRKAQCLKITQKVSYS